MRWVGLNDGYVSGDGRFLVTKVAVAGRKGTTTMWALYGLVYLSGDAVTWRWTECPLFGPVATKRACQAHATSLDYVPSSLDEAASVQAPAPALPIKQIGYGICQECGVTYPRAAKWIFGDLCGPNCFAIAEERVQEIRAELTRRGR